MIFGTSSHSVTYIFIKFIVDNTPIIMVKKHKLVFFQLTFIFISLLGYFFSIERPFYFYNQDAEVDYFINSLLVSMGKETWSFHHPGILNLRTEDTVELTRKLVKLE